MGKRGVGFATQPQPHSVLRSAFPLEAKANSPASAGYRVYLAGVRTRFGGFSRSGCRNALDLRNRIFNSSSGIKRDLGNAEEQAQTRKHQPAP
jgi:hypothetical protein